ncbi:hypothetical protein BKA67DRAFT_654051 [Truncatella angustata]|uniref:Uncharacterized protein n=1 Tax=Truncatella angustata TaxID=152316 RepID=A0A9P8UYW0_9PEZI|nr:uncharacterized protein BKA67DRAFT_654051 [Truncatella angustata]KAH6660898.1 hypothetical protein BKA67DRAFT_654051 [Truncatella angustata]KAH8199219.1 hypothetical protein TruAng_006625 [Truncatella angustata]
MTTFDTSASNGTCYWKVGSEAGSEFIPCGNAFAPGIDFQCCSVGDKCFDNGACYNDKYGATYLAACTDPTYKASECQNKGKYSEQQWNGLVICGNPTDPWTKNVSWAGCPEVDIDHLTTFSKGCQCNDTNPPLFTDYAVLVSTAILPQTSGGTLRFINGHSAPTISTIPTQMTAGKSTTAAVSTSILASTLSATEEATKTADDEATLSTGAKAGIGAGAAIAALFLGTLAILIWLLKKRNLGKKKDGEPESEPKPQQSPWPDSTSSAESSSVPSSNAHPNAPSFSGYKAELAADGPPSGGSIVSSMSTASPQFPTQQRQYEAYNPDIHGNYPQYANRSELHSPQRDTMHSAVSSVSPQHTGSAQNHVTGGIESSAQQTMAPIAELQG